MSVGVRHALNETSGEFGFALGIAVMGSIATAIYRGHVADAIPAGVPASAAAAARDTLAGAVASAQHLSSDVAAALLVPAREGFVSGLHIVAAIAAVVMIGVALLAVRMLRHVDAYSQDDSPEGTGGVGPTTEVGALEPVPVGCGR